MFNYKEQKAVILQNPITLNWSTAHIDYKVDGQQDSYPVSVKGLNISLKRNHDIIRKLWMLPSVNSTQLSSSSDVSNSAGLPDSIHTATHSKVFDIPLSSRLNVVDQNSRDKLTLMGLK